MAIRYNKNVKKPNEEMGFTPEQIIKLQECKKDFWKFVKYIQIVNPDKGEIYFEPYDYQKELLTKFMKHRFNVGLASRQSGKTTTVVAYALWYAIFNDNKNIGIVSNKEKTAKMIISRFKQMYEALPNWLKPGVESYAKTYVEFDNKTKVVISATSPNAFRGESMNLLILDEFAFVPRGQATEFWASNYPTISASKDSRIIIISTPNGMFNTFHQIYSGAENKLNSFVHTKVSWQKVPGRDTKWKNRQLKNMSKQQFLQEYAVEFVGSTNTVIDSDVLETIINTWKSPLRTELDGKVIVYRKPEEGEKFVLGVDTAKGTGEHYSSIQVLRIISLNPVKLDQVLTYNYNHVDVYNFTDIVDRIARYYNNAYIMVENNAEGNTVVSRLWWDLNNQGLVNSGSKTIDLGIRATRNSKPKAVLLMKRLIEDGSLRLVDKGTIEQLLSYIEEKNKFYGKDKEDDLVSALYWAVYILEMNILDEGYNFRPTNMDSEDAWGIISDIRGSEDEDFSWLHSTGNFYG